MTPPWRPAVMLLAAGRGDRLRPVSDTTPKPLLRVHDHALIEHHLYRIAQQGYPEVVINVSYQAEKIKMALGDGSRYGLKILYSDEGEHALETAGGIRQALPLLNSDTLFIINADLFIEDLPQPQPLTHKDVAHLFLVENPQDHPQGDFALDANRILPLGQGWKRSLTFSGMGYYRRDWFASLEAGKRKLAGFLHQAVYQNQVRGEIYQGRWINVGTQEQLQKARSL